MWQPRWALVGDSIQAWVLEAGGLSVSGQAKYLTASRVPNQVNASIQNVSCPGMRLAKGNAAGTDGVFDLGVIDDLHGPFGLNGVVCTLGTNDYSNSNVTPLDYFLALATLCNKMKAMGVPLVLVSPVWRSDQNTPVAKYDGNSHVLNDFRNAVAYVASLYVPADKIHFIDGSAAPLNASHFGDGLHLNGVGHVAFSNWLVTQMKSKGLWSAY